MQMNKAEIALLDRLGVFDNMQILNWVKNLRTSTNNSIPNYWYEL